MKKTLIALALFLSLNVCFASFGIERQKAQPSATAQTTDQSVTTPPTTTNETASPLTKQQQQKALMEEVSRMSVKDYENLTGKRLNAVDRLTFKIIKHRFAQKLRMAGDNDSEGFRIGGFLLGFFLGLLGVLGAYIFSKDRNFRKWTWIGWGVFVAVYLIVTLAA